MEIFEIDKKTAYYSDNPFNYQIMDAEKQLADQAGEIEALRQALRARNTAETEC